MTRNPLGSSYAGDGAGVPLHFMAPGSVCSGYNDARFLTLCEIVRQLCGKAITSPRKEAVLADVRPKYRFKLSSADAALDSFAYLLTCSTAAHCAAASPTWLTQHLVKLAIAWDFRDRPSSSKENDPCGDTDTSPDAYQKICTAAESIVRIVTSYHRATSPVERSALESTLVKLSFRKIYSRWLRCSTFLERLITHPVFYKEDDAFEKASLREARAGNLQSNGRNNVNSHGNTPTHINNSHNNHSHNHHHHHSIKDDEDSTEIALRIKILEDSTGKELGYQGYFLYVLRSLQALFSNIASSYLDEELDDKAAENTAIALDALWHLTERSPRFRHFISIQPCGGGSKQPDLDADPEIYDPGDDANQLNSSRNANFRKLAKLSAISGAIGSVLGCKFLRKISKSCRFELEFIRDKDTPESPSSSVSLPPCVNVAYKWDDASDDYGDGNGNGHTDGNANGTRNGNTNGTDNSNGTGDVNSISSLCKFENIETVCSYLLPWMHMPPTALDDALTALAVLGFAPVPRNPGTHAEMLIACHLQRLNIAKTRPYYIGTSRYPCFVCEIYISRIPGIIVHRGKGETIPCVMPYVVDRNGYCNAAREFVFTRVCSVAADELTSAMNHMKLIETPSSEEDGEIIDLFS